jgi:KaiC/GvpD/RAD55 family RecA-like ATPase
MNYSEEELQKMSYRELQEVAKEEDINATGTQEELLENLKNNLTESDPKSKFGDVKENIENELAQKKVETKDINRLKTGVKGLDKILNGGIPEKNLTLVSGGPGSGKTTIGLQFLLEGIRNGETGVYVNLDERKEKIIRNAELFGWDLEEHEENKNLHFVRPNIFDFKKAKKQIDKIASRFDADRIVIDSLSVLASTVNSESKMRRGIMELNQRFNRLDATTLSISEVEGDSISKYGVEEYAVDGIIRLYFKRQGSNFQRGLAVKKMRGSNHSKTLHPIEIGKKGVTAYPDQKVFKKM